VNYVTPAANHVTQKVHAVLIFTGMYNTLFQNTRVSSGLIKLSMKIKDTKVMRGPNYWSDKRHKLIVMKLDLQLNDHFSAEETERFQSHLHQLLPELASMGFESLETSAPAQKTEHVVCQAIVNTALHLQQLAGMSCIHGDAYLLQTGEYKIVFDYISEKAGKLAATAAVQLAEASLNQQSFDVNETIAKLKAILRNEAFGPSTQSIIDEASKRGIPFTRLNEDSLVQLGYGQNQQLLRATVVGTTRSLAVDIAGCKWTTKKLLQKNGIPVPKGVIIDDASEVEAAISEVGFPVVVKPIDGNHGRGITTNITSQEEAITAFGVAQQISDSVIVEQSVSGDDYRFLVINYKLIAVAKRTPAMVTGDARSTITQLIDRVNEHPNRGDGHRQVLTKIKLDQHTISLLEEAGMTPETILPEGCEVFLKRTANLSTGGTATDVTDLVHPDNVFMAERIARLLHLDVCGIDLMAHDVTIPVTTKNSAVIEVNAGPGFRMHTHPSEGQPRNVAEPVVDMLFPEKANGRIPVVAITGTNGKTTTTRLMAHLAKHAGFSAGYTTTEGIYIDGHVIVKGDCSGPKSTEIVLGDPSVNFAVLECARGGILRSGLAFDQCDVSIVTNVTEDHLGLGDIHTMEEYARVKEVVAQSTAKDGYAILNADDDLVYAMKERLSCNVILFSTDGSNQRIADHCESGEMAITIEDGWYVICDDNKKTRVIAVNDIPLTYSGSAEFMVKNILPALAASLVSGFGITTIREGLRTFAASPETTPGRMNLFDFGDFRIMLDYAHNAAGFIEIEKYMSTVSARKKVGIIAATGDRKEDDIINQGYYAARIFDEIIIRHDADGRGRTPDQLTALLTEGIHREDPQKPITVITNEKDAIGYAIDQAQPDTFIFTCADDVWESIELIEELHRKILH